MTERAIAAGAPPPQEPRNKGATLEDTSLATNGTAHNIATSKATPLERQISSSTPASCRRDIAESPHQPVTSSTAVLASAPPTVYRSVVIQTLPPKDAEQFHRIYDREPTAQELISKTGSAAIGRYGPGLSANPHDVVFSTPFSTPTVPKGRANYTDSSFQTDDFSERKRTLLRAKVKASLLVNKQRDAARSSGFKVWSETRDEYIVHSEQFYISVHFDGQGNAINMNVDGLSLPNIYGEKMEINKDAKDHASNATPMSNPPTTPPSVTLYNTVSEANTPQRIRTVEPRVPSDKSEPASIEYYGYLKLIPREATEKHNNGDRGDNKQQHKSSNLRVSDLAATKDHKDGLSEIVREEVTAIVIGGERFADEYIVFDATALTPATSITPFDAPLASPRKRKSEDKWEPEVAASSPKRSKTSDAHTSSLQFETSTRKDYRARDQDEYAERSDRKDAGIDHMQPDLDMRSAEGLKDRTSTPQKTYKDESGVEDGFDSRNSQAHRTSRRRSRSVVDRRTSFRFRSKSSVRHGSENTYEDECRRHKVACEMEIDSRTYDGMNTAHTDKQDESREGKECNKQKKDVGRIVSAHKIEHDRRRKQEKRAEEEKLANRRRMEEDEMQRAREAKNRQNLVFEGKKQAQQADRQRRHEKRGSDRDRRHRRRDLQERVSREHQQREKQEAVPSEPVDAYAAARDVEARRRERAFVARGTSEADSRGHERPPARNESSTILEVKLPEPKKKVKEGRVTKPRLSRTTRGELKRYDPRKKFGGSK